MDFYIFRRFLVIIPAEPIFKKTIKQERRRAIKSESPLGEGVRLLSFRPS